MQVCYVDEAGCTGALPSSTAEIQPVFSVAGVIVDVEHIPNITESFLCLKQKFFPKQFPTKFLSGVLVEIKGSDLRKQIAGYSRNERRHAFGFLDGVKNIIQENNIKIIGRTWIKGIGQPIDGISIYTYSIQSICKTLQQYLSENNDIGTVLLDSRMPWQNSRVAHSIFTQKFQAAGDSYKRLIDLPSFGHSQNHAGLQIADLVASAFIFPIAINSYCAGHVANVHVKSNYCKIKERYAPFLKGQQFRYEDTNSKRTGGIIVSDGLSHKSGRFLFEEEIVEAVQKIHAQA